MQGAIVTFTKGLSSHLISRGIRVNAIAPGPVWTPLVVASFPSEMVSKPFFQLCLLLCSQHAYSCAQCIHLLWSCRSHRNMSIHVHALVTAFRYLKLTRSGFADQHLWHRHDTHSSPRPAKRVWPPCSVPCNRDRLVICCGSNSECDWWHAHQLDGVEQDV